MQRTNIYLDDRQAKELKRLARSRGMSRAALIRELLDDALALDDDDLADDLAAINDSFGSLAEADLQLERGPDRRGEHLERIATS